MCEPKDAKRVSEELYFQIAVVTSSPTDGGIILILICSKVIGGCNRADAYGVSIAKCGCPQACMAGGNFDQALGSAFSLFLKHAYMRPGSLLDQRYVLQKLQQPYLRLHPEGATVC